MRTGVQTITDVRGKGINTDDICCGIAGSFGVAANMGGAVGRSFGPFVRCFFIRLSFGVAGVSLERSARVGFCVGSMRFVGMVELFLFPRRCRQLWMVNL